MSTETLEFKHFTKPRQFYHQRFGNTEIENLFYTWLLILIMHILYQFTIVMSVFTSFVTMCRPTALYSPTAWPEINFYLISSLKVIGPRPM